MSSFSYAQPSEDDKVAYDSEVKSQIRAVGLAKGYQTILRYKGDFVLVFPQQLHLTILIPDMTEWFN